MALGKTCEVDTADDMETDLTDSDYQCKRIDGSKIPNKDFDVTLPYGKYCYVFSLEVSTEG